MFKFLICDGCEDRFTELLPRTWHDSWDSGEDITGDYCGECAGMVDDGLALPNMSGRFVSPDFDN